ncbi:MAG: hypothetical protein C5B55_04200 [Blastocatellia bacterium]|nr:MAG: hypothetical protein C5B55_04200 [Blastocatellia bacterium]
MTAITLLALLSLVLSWTSLDAEQQRSAETLANQPKLETNSPLLETGTTTTVRKPIPLDSDIKILSYNIRWRGGEDLDKLIKLFRDDPEIGNAAFLCLQEVDRNKKRTHQKNTVRHVANQLDLHYAWTAPPTAKATDEEETGVAILSRFPLAQITRIVLPNAGPNHRRRVALGATVDMGGTKLRLYSVHGETRIAIKKKMEQLDAVIQDLAQFPKDMPAIIAGDFNTWDPGAGKKTRELFTKAGFQTPFGGDPTLRYMLLFVPIDLKLDWIWMKGLQPVSSGIGRNINISDHWPLWANFKQLPSASNK